MTILASDNFNRTNADPAGGNWTTVTSQASWKVASNTLQPSNLANDSSAYWNANTPPNDHWVEAKITVTGTTFDIGPGVSARVSTSQNTQYRVTVNKRSSSNVTLAKFVNNVYTQIWRRTQAWTDGDVLRLEVQGTTLRVYRNGTQIGTDSTDSSIASGRAGVHYSSSASVATIDDWSMGDFAVTVNAECPQTSVVSNDGDASIAPHAGNATVTLIANNPTTSVKVSAGAASIVFSANDATVTTGSNSVDVFAECPTIVVASNDAANSIVSNAGVANVAITANDVDPGVNPSASNAAITVAANNPKLSVSVAAQVAAIALTANNATPRVATSPTNALANLVANSLSTKVFANAAVASVAFTTDKPGTGRTPTAPTAAFVAGDVDGKISVNAEAASVSAVANDSTVSTSGNTNAQAGNASVTVTANQPGKSVSVNAGLASLVMAAQQAAPASRVGAGVAGITVGSLTPTAAVLAAAGIASVGWTANNTTTKVSPTSDYSTVQIGALSATVPAQFLGPPDLIIKKLSTSTTVNDKSNSVTCSGKTGVLTVTDQSNGLIIKKVDNTVTVNE